MSQDSSLIGVVASELEELRENDAGKGTRVGLPKAHSLSPPRPPPPPCEESSQSSSSSEDDGFGGNMSRSLSQKKTADSGRSSRTRSTDFRRAHNTFNDFSSSSATMRPQRCGLPPASLVLLRSLPGSSRCVDCSDLNPEWASVTYGVLLCVSCAGRHRSLGVRVREKPFCDFDLCYSALTRSEYALTLSVLVLSPRCSPASRKQMRPRTRTNQRDRPPSSDPWRWIPGPTPRSCPCSRAGMSS